MKKQFSSLDEFWPYYCSQHLHPWTRALHVVGLILFVVVFIISILSSMPILFLLIPVAGYFPAWVAHFFIEKNKPATFRHPFYSLICDFKMCGMIILNRPLPTQKRRLNDEG